MHKKLFSSNINCEGDHVSECSLIYNQCYKKIKKLVPFQLVKKILTFYEILIFITFNDSPHMEPILRHICGPTRAMVSSFLRFLDHTQRQNTLCGAPLDEWSSRRTYLYLATHKTHKRQTPMTLTRFEPIIPARSRDHRDRHFSNIHFNITFASTKYVANVGLLLRGFQIIFFYIYYLSHARYMFRSSDPPLFYLYRVSQEECAILRESVPIPI